MKGFRVAAIGIIVVGLSVPVMAQQRWVSDFTNLTVTPVVTAEGPPVQVDMTLRADTSGWWTTSPGESVWMYGAMSNGSHWDYGSGYVTRTPGTNSFETTYSLTLGQPGVYDYFALAYYYYYYSSSFYSTYSTGATGQFNTVSRAGIPTLSSVGLALLGLLTAGIGVFLLRRT